MSQSDRRDAPPAPAGPATPALDGDSATVTPSSHEAAQGQGRRPVTCRCQGCGQTWTALLAPGRRPVMCPTCRPAYEAELAARRMRRYRTRASERAEHEAYVHEQRVRWCADRLLAQHPAAARVLAEVPYELAEDVVQELARRLAEAEAERREE